MKRLEGYVACFFIVCLFSSAKAQEVTASAGNYYSKDNIQISWTLGEPVIETISDENFQLTQGFHQSEMIITAVHDLSMVNMDIAVYPNPTNDYLKLKVENAEDQNLYYTLFSTDGRMIVHQSIESDVSEIPMYNYIPATYFLKISDRNVNIKTFKILKK